MQVFSLLLLMSIVILGLVISTEVMLPGLVQEGFANFPEPSYWANYVSPRSDIGLDAQEDSDYIRDPRYFNDYTDVSRLGVNYDFCRVVAHRRDPDNKFFACALAGTDNLESTKFRTRGTKDGFKLSVDDYMRDINGDGRADYCRILPSGSDWQPMCVRATDWSFDQQEVVDSDPPADIATLLTFYQGCEMWFRFDETIADTIGSAKAGLSGGIAIDETPNQTVVYGLEFNGFSQFLRISDSPGMTLGFMVPLRAIRAVMMWVRFDEFTNNAKIFDFGNGKGKDNFFLGILGKGDPDVGTDSLRPVQCVSEDSPLATVPTGPSGAQRVEEMSPQELLAKGDANVNDFECSGFNVLPRKMKKSMPQVPTVAKGAKSATLIYEVWDKEQRRMRMKVNAAVRRGEWTHICVTTTSGDAFRPDMAIYVNGRKVLMRASGFLPSTQMMTNCYIGKSNWANNVSKYENRDELFKGAMYDFRFYSQMVSEEFIGSVVAWGKGKLGLEGTEPEILSYS